MLSRSSTPTNEDNSIADPMQGIQMVEFALSGDEISDNQLNNSNVSNKSNSLSLENKDVKSITNDLSRDGEIETEDEVEEEIAEESIESVVSEASALGGKRRTASKHDNSARSRTESGESNSNRSISRTASKSPLQSDHSYTEDFSAASDRTISDS